MQTPLMLKTNGAATGVSTVTATSYSCSRLFSLPVAVITYVNNYGNPSGLTAIVYGVAHNSLGQTVYYTTATLFFQGLEDSESAYLAIPGLARGNYSISAFAITTSGIAISTTTTLFCSV